MNITELAECLNKYAAHAVLKNDVQKRAYANQAWELWKRASGVGEQLQQNLNEEKLKKNVTKMNRTAEKLVTQPMPLLHPGLFTPKTSGFMDMNEINHNLGIALFADTTSQALQPKYAIAKTANEINSEFGVSLLLERMGLQVCSK